MLTISNNWRKIGGAVMARFGDAERRILSYFEKGTKIIYKNKEYEIVEAGKPTCPYGEPKTDIYVLVENAFNTEEIKISYKKENADFLENKTNAERAEQLFGEDWRLVIEESTYAVKEQFEERARIYKEAFRRTEKGSITLGWKFELLNKPAGDLSGRMNLTRQQIYDVYAGTNLSEDKKDAFVNGKRVYNSGVADYILVTDYVNSAQDIIDQMIPISEYIEMHPNIYFACKALNYRTYASKYDGNRPLAVQVDWKVYDGKLVSDIVYEYPLEKNGTEMANRLLNCLKRLSIETTDDIDEDNADMRHVYE